MMDATTLKKVKVVPKEPRFISDILPNNGRITEETTKNLNTKEIIRCMQFANCYEGETLLTPENFMDDPTEELLQDPAPATPPTTQPGAESTPSVPKENVIAGGTTAATQSAKEASKAVK